MSIYLWPLRLPFATKSPGCTCPNAGPKSEERKRKPHSPGAGLGPGLMGGQVTEEAWLGVLWCRETVGDVASLRQGEW